MLQALDEALVDEGVEEVELVGAVIHDVADDVLEHVLGEVHVVLEIGEGDLGLHHPELGGMALRVGVLSAERRAEGVDVAERHGEVLGLELARNREVGSLAEEVLAVVDVAMVVERRVGRVDRGHVEHLAGALAVACGDDGRVHIDEAALLEEGVDGEGGHGAHAEHGAEQVGAGAQVLDGAQELDGVALLLQRVVGGRGTLDLDGKRLELEGLLSAGR